MKQFNEEDRKAKGNIAISVLMLSACVGLFIYFVLEVVSFYYASQQVGSLTRESANIMVRSCAREESVEMSGCVRTVLDKLERSVLTTGIRNFNQKGKLIVSILIWDTNQKYIKKEVEASVGGGSNGAFISRFQPDTLNEDTRLLVQELGVLVVTEAYYLYDPLTPINKFIQGFDGFFYDASAI